MENPFKGLRIPETVAKLPEVAAMIGIAAVGIVVAVPAALWARMRDVPNPTKS